MRPDRSRIEDAYPLAPLQQGILFHCLSSSAKDMYVGQFIADIQGELDAALLHKAWQMVIARHPILRTSFVWDGLEEPVQRVHREVVIPFESIDLSDLDDTQRRDQFSQFCSTELSRGFNLSQAPLVRVGLIKWNPTSYRMVVTEHLILLDGWSGAVVRNEVFRQYATLKHQGLDEITTPRPYRDFVSWLQRQDAGKAERFWKRSLESFTQPTLLADARRNTSGQDGKSGQIELRVPAELSGALKTLARRQNLTLNTFTQGAWALLLSRHAGQSDIVYGVTVSGRPPELVGVESMVGSFINTLPLRVQVPPKTTILAWLQSIQQNQAELQGFSYTPLVKAQAASGLPAGTPLFDSILVFENFWVDRALENREGPKVEWWPGVERVNYPLTVIVEPHTEIRVHFQFDRDRLDEDSVLRISKQFERILASFVSHPEGRLGDVDLLTEGERRLLLADWGDATKEFRQTTCAHGLFEAQAKKTPEAVAVSYGEERMTYGELNRRANQLAWFLKKRGVGPEMLVGLCVERSIEMVVGLLGILKAGGGYLPLDPTYPQGRIEYMLSDSKAAMVLTQKQLMSRLPANGTKVICLDSEWDAIRTAGDQDPPAMLAPENLAYVIYTSGSTGNPKGVQIPHGNIVRLFEATRHWFGFNSQDVWTLFHSYAFDFSVWEMWGALIYGGRLVIVPYDVSRAPDLFYKLLRHERVTVLNQTPSAFRQIIGVEGVIGAAHDLALRWVIFGGEALEPQALAPWFVAHGDVQPTLVNMYGITETTVHVTYRPLLASESGSSRSVIGRQIPDLQLYILDPGLGVTPVGVLGEIYVGGDGVARGYLNRPELTAERFVPNPFGARMGSRLYRTGDLGRYLPGGDIEYLGRIDTQVKVRGFRIELGEIEAALCRQAGVKEAVVIMREDRPGDKRLVGYVVGGGLDVGALRSKLQSALPDYMVPSALVILPATPLTSNGKLDRLALPPPDVSAAPMGTYIAPRTAVEDVLCAIWARVLGAERVGLSDNFFELGGHSLLAMKVVTRTNKAFGTEVSVRTLFEAPTVDRFAERVQNATRIGSALDGQALAPVSRAERLPLSFAQQRLWFLEQLDPGKATYHIPFVVKLRGALDVEALGRALSYIVARHEALRTSFSVDKDEPYQVISSPTQIDINVEDLTGLPLDKRKAKSEAWLAAQVETPFDLSNGPLIRTAVARLAPDEHLWVLNIHHIVSDGTSQEILFKELTDLYASFRQDREPGLPPLAIQYADYAAWQRKRLSGDALARELSYWTEQLAAVPGLDLPTDAARPARQSYRGATHTFAVPPDLWQKIRSLGRQQDATPFIGLLTVFEALLSRYTGQDDFCVGTPIEGRMHSDLSPLVGFFVNTLALRVRLPKRSTFAQAVRRTRETALGAYAHQEIPFETLVGALGLERDLSRSPLFQVLFALTNVPLGAMSLEGLELENVDYPWTTSKFDLSLFAEEREGSLSCTFEYSADLFRAQSIERMATHFGVLLESIASHPDAKLEDIDLLSPGEKRQMLTEWNDPSADFRRGACAHQLFEAQVRENPHAIAVVCGEERLTYEELNRRANKLGWHLKRHGVGPEVLVGLCIERSVEMVVGLLGILKAGGAYVPLDPSYPQGRLEYMLKDSKAPVLVTHSSLISRLSSGGCKVICLDKDWKTIDDEKPSDLVGSATPLNAAYAIYTSGSTGNPKGVLVPHGNIVRLFDSTQDWFDFNSRDVWTMFHSYAFDFSVWELWGALIYGGRVVVVPFDVSRSPDLLYKLLRREGVTVLNQTPSAFRQLTAVEEGLGVADDLALRMIIFGGEALDPQTLAPWFRAHGDERPRLVNMYGITETTVHVTYRPLRAQDAGLSRIDIGRSLPDLQTYVLDSRFGLAPAGVPGELYVGGDGVARGYLNRPDLTAARFVPNPFGTRPGGRLYRTGDLGRYLTDGTIEYLGRIDTQVKVRGFRIELGEIEAALSRQAGVKDALVIVREDSPGDKRLVAYVTAAPGATLDPSLLRTGLKEGLPDHMIPVAFVALQAIPLTDNGKLDRRSLPAPENSSVATAAHQAPQNAMEEALCAVWSEVLGISNVGAGDNFFELGGDSILSIRVVSKAMQRGIRVTPAQVFKQPTLRDLASVARSLAAQGDDGLVTGQVPLSPIQKWFFEQDIVHRDHWNQATLLTAKHTLEPALLRGALNAVMQHHDALRSRFLTGPEGIQQKVEPTCDVRLQEADLSKEPESERHRLIGVISGEAQAGLSMADGRLVAPVLFNMGPGEAQRLLLAIHHLVIDSVSWHILLEDLSSAYEQLRSGKQVRLSRKTTSFKAWAETLENLGRSPEMREEAKYWLSIEKKSQSAGTLPRDDSTKANTKSSATTLRVDLTVEDTRQLLKTLPTAFHTEINDVLLTALAEAIGRWSDSERVSLILEGHGREEDIAPGANLSGTVGWFTTLFPVVLHRARGASVIETLQAVKEELRSIPRRGIGYGVLRYLSKKEPPTPLGAPWPEVCFNYLGQFDGSFSESSMWRPAKESTGRTDSAEGIRLHLLDVSCAVLDEKLQVTWTYSENIHQSATIERVAKHYVDVLKELIAASTRPLERQPEPSDFPLLRVTRQQAKDLGAVEDAYPLTPLQQGVLFHALTEEASDMYLAQFVHEVRGELNPRVLKQAWEWATERHATLRTSYVWEGFSEPIQRVHRFAGLAWEEHDIRGKDIRAQQSWFRDHLKSQLDKKFVLTSDPLMRFSLVRTEDDVHSLVWTSHLILLDGWSTAILWGEVMSAYADGIGGRPMTRTPPRPYRDFLTWLSKRDSKKADLFWKETLGSLDEPTLLMSDAQRRPAGKNSKSRGVAFHLSTKATARLLPLAKRHNLTVNTLVQGAWAILLSRYTGQKDVVFGVTVSGRPPELEGVESMVGSFINTLPLRVRVRSGERLATWLKEMQGSQLELREYSHTPLVKAQAASGVRRGTPLFDNIMVFQNYAESKIPEAPGAIQIRLTEAFERINYPLVVMVAIGDTLDVHFQFDEGCIDEQRVGELWTHLEHILESMDSHLADGRVADIDLMSEGERRRISEEWNATEAKYPKDVFFPQLFEAQARRDSNALAVSSEAGGLTYGELNARANRLARYLTKRGVGPEVIVALSVERSIDMLVGLLGILKAGGAYLPLDPSYPSERVAYMLNDSKASVVVTNIGSLSRLRPGAQTVVCLDRDWGEIQRESDGAIPSRITRDSLAYVIYTSGSTGKPKGTMLHHGGLANYLNWAARLYEVSSSGGAPVQSSLSFDLTVTSLLLPLTVGKPVMLVPEAEDPAEVMEKLVGAGSQTLVKITPAHLRVLNQVTASRSLTSNFQTMVIGGDVLTGSDVRPWLDRFPNLNLFNEYGPTETVVGCCVRRIGLEDALENEVGIGSPTANSRLYILDAEFRLAPLNVSGELCIGGDQVGRGYLGQPDLTAEKFVPDPFSAVPGARLYRTGDLARRLSDGQLQFLGRMDNQVKVRGFRIELGEVEAVLASHPAIRSAAVVARSSVSGEKRLVAYVSGDIASSDVGAIRDYLGERLPEYMVPAAVVVLAALPLTSNGKVDRRSLPEPEATAADSLNSAPTTLVEKALAAIWADVLQVDRVGRFDDFFELGGDSILAIRVVSKAAQEGLRITPGQLFKHRSLSQLAAVEGASSAQAEQGAVVGSVPLTPIQHWLFEQDLLAPAQVNQWMMFEFSQPMTVGLIQRALQELTAHHDALRMRFYPGDAGWIQVNEASAEVVLVGVDLADLPVAEQRRRMRAAATEAQNGLDLSRGPLMSAVLFTRNNEPSRLLLVIHHLVVDVVSWRILLEDLGTLLGQFKRDERPKLPAKTTSFKTWAHRLSAFCQTPQIKEELSSTWRPLLGRTQHGPLPFDVPGGDLSSAPAERMSVSLDAAETRDLLRRVPAAYGTEVNDALLATLAQAFASSSGQESILIDLEGHGREEDLVENVDLTRTVGWFTSIFPVQLNWTPGIDPVSGLRAMREELRRLPHRGIGFGVLRYMTPEGRELEPLSHPRVSFNYLGQLDESPTTTAPLIRPVWDGDGPEANPRERRPHLIDIIASVTDGRLIVEWVYNAGAYRADTIRRVGEAQLSALRALIDLSRASTSDGTRTGERALPLTQMQKWFLDLNLPDHRFYMFGQYVTVAQGCSTAQMESVISELLRRHEGLRLRLRRVNGEWRQYLGPVIDSYLDAPLTVNAKTETEFCAQVDAAALGLAEGVDLDGGPLFRVKPVNGTSESGLILVVHHLIADGESMGLLVKDFEIACRKVVGGTAAFGRSSPPFSAFSDKMAKESFAKDIETEVEFWAAQASKRVAPLPQDIAGIPSFDSESRVSAMHSENGHPAAIRGRAGVSAFDVVFAAFACAIGRWTGGAPVGVWVESNGRNALPDFDATGVFGPINQWFPVVVPPSSIGDPNATYQIVRDLFARLPNRGRRFGLVAPEIVRDRRIAPAPLELCFNVAVVPDTSDVTSLSRRISMGSFKKGPLPFALTFRSLLRGSELTTDWIYSSATHRSETVQELSRDTFSCLLTLTKMLKLS